MKILILSLTLIMIMAGANAQKSEPANLEQPSADRGRKVDVTLSVNGYIVRINGSVTYNVLNGSFSFEGNVTVSGMGENITLTVRYAGPLKKGPNNYKFHKEVLPKQDAEAVDLILSRLYLQDARKIWFDSN